MGPLQIIGSLKKNPIILDANKARNAGLIFDGKNHFRINQKIGFNNYGTGFEINIIDEINDKVYKETLCEIVSSELLKGYKGTHHLSSIDSFSVIDVKNFQINIKKYICLQDKIITRN